MDKDMLKFAAKFEKDNVDLDNRVITDVIIASSKVNDKDKRSVHITAEFLRKVADIAPAKVPTEYDHNYWGQMGRKLGYMDNIRYSSGDLIGDLHIYKSSDKSPTAPGMGTYILEQAKEDADAYMMSFIIDVEYSEESDKMEPTKLNSIDVVSNGAITTSMFSSDTLLNHFTELSKIEGFEKFIEDNLKKLPVINKVYKAHYSKTITDHVASVFGLKPNEEEENSDLEELYATKESELFDLQKKYDTLCTEKEALSTKVGELQASVDTQASRIQELENEAGADEEEEDEETFTSESGGAFAEYFRKKLNA